ncbi:hypothetical protein PORCRE_473 [Porphyromonas crevioricanis JCM 15906]|uniref:Peptidase C1A papain C-terminal domain-containing protein n=2 Tax=Porphyromonas crevioricanis TaxID=393921 RepID=T1CM74_9PORP|nr:hypothetical protein PORCRE_473 [Porphyromonas crevioricanis JCM 15906]
MKTPYRSSLTKISYAVENNESFSITDVEELKQIVFLGIDAELFFTSPTGIFRILLKDKKGGSYLIARGIGALADENKRITLENVALETSALQAIDVQSINFELRECTVQLHSINYTKQEMSSKSFAKMKLDADKMRLEAIDAEILAINKYNTKWGIPWVAKRTELSERPYEEKIHILKDFSDESDYYGIEYFADGAYVHFPILEAYKEIHCPDSIKGTQYVESFSWRNRHGKNWNTPAKSQGSTDGCWAFSAVATLEAYYNLCRGEVLEGLDLSEQDMISCSEAMDSVNGETVFPGYTFEAAEYAASTGISYEEENPWLWKYVSCDELSHSGPKIRALSSVYKKNSTSSMIDALLKHGPLVASVHYFKHNIDTLGIQHGSGHAMSLTGYGVVGEEDWELFWPSEDGTITHIEFDKTSPFYGKVYWEFKNSFGEDHGDNGYMRMLRYEGRTKNGVSRSCSIGTLAFSGGVEEGGVKVHPVVSDRDGDGFYFWGIGPKPQYAPEYVPDTPDGDDNNPNTGMIDEFGRCYNNLFSKHLVIDNHVSLIWEGIVGSIRVKSGGHLFIPRKVNCTQATITLEPGAELTIMEGGMIYNVEKFSAFPGSKTTFMDQGKIVMSQKGKVKIDRGAELIIKSGGFIRAQRQIINPK